MSKNSLSCASRLRVPYILLLAWFGPSFSTPASSLSFHINIPFFPIFMIIPRNFNIYLRTWHLSSNLIFISSCEYLIKRHNDFGPTFLLKIVSGLLPRFRPFGPFFDENDFMIYFWKSNLQYNADLPDDPNQSYSRDNLGFKFNRYGLYTIDPNFIRENKSLSFFRKVSTVTSSGTKQETVWPKPGREVPEMRMHGSGLIHRT